MRKPRTNILMLTTIFGVVGLIGLAWLTGKSDFTTFAGLESETMASQARPVAPALLASGKTPDAEAVTPGANPTIRALPAQPLSDEANALVVEMCDLQLLADGTDFTLDSRQWTAFATVELRFQAIRHAYEAQIAQMHQIASGRYQVEIPMYAGAGDELRQEFSADLCAALGESTALELMAKFGDRLEGRFAGFGVSAQTLDIIASPAVEPNDVQVTRTVRYWNSVAGSDGLTIRQEVYFPDSTGQGWNALLAKVGVKTTDSGPG